jgi:saccharopine dehydrogenase-like NADP-dependent oxidoreductase
MTVHVLVLGAGHVAQPIVRYLVERPTYRVTVASRSVEKARELVAGKLRGEAMALDLEGSGLDSAVRKADIVVSLVPYAYHPRIAERCIAWRKHLVTTSYVSADMRSLDEAARKAGVSLVNELGLDPGIDHMSATRIFRAVRDRGGRVTGFRSFCGGLPTPESNDNPFGYKFSWSPHGAVTAATRPARYLAGGREVVVPAAELFDAPEPVTVEGAGTLEAYPNRDALAYLAPYRLDSVHTMYRGTLRYAGHCRTWKALTELGLLDGSPRHERTYRTLLASLARVAPEDLEGHLRLRFGEDEGSPAHKIAWLGLCGDGPLPRSPIAPLEALVSAMEARLRYGTADADMIALLHVVDAEYQGGSGERIRSWLVYSGEPGGETAMARTVALPAALGVEAIVRGGIVDAGVQVPTDPRICDFVLGGLAGLGIEMTEQRWAKA